MKTYRFSLAISQCALFALFLLSASHLQSQSTTIQLLDKTSNIPIAEATFIYGDQSGLSNESGYVEFRYEAGNAMELSHVAYGEWTLSDDALRAAMQTGSVYQAPLKFDLYPVTIIALRKKSDQTKTLEFDFQDKLAHDGGAVLTQTPAISVIRKSGNYGFDPVLRGFKYDQLNVVLNGAQSAVAACPNRMDPPTSQMAPNMLDRVEILKGPHALRYGNSFGGTINFIASEPRFSDAANTYGRWSGTYESNGDIFRTEGHLGFSGKRYDLGVFAAWSQGNDYRDGDDITVPADFLRGSFGANLDWKLADNQTLTASATRNLARDADFPALPMDLREDDTWLFNARHEIKFDNTALQSWNTTLFGSFVDHLMDNRLKSLDPRMLNAETDAQTRSYGGRTESVWKQRNGVLYAGADLRVEEAEGVRTREFLMGPNAGRTFTDNAWQDGRISKSGLFAEYHLSGQSNWRFVFSGRVEWNQAQIADAQDEFTNVNPETDITQINPSLSIGTVKNFGNNISLGLWLGRAQRSGGLTERFINYFPVGQDPFELLGNPQLDPEVNNQADLTFSFETERTALCVDVFASYLQDYITAFIAPDLSPRLPNSPGVRRFENIGEAFKTGFEVSWSQQLIAGLQHELSFAYTYGQDLEREEPLPEIAPLDFRYTLAGSYLRDRLRPEVTLRHVLEQGRISEEFGETVTPAFTLLDVQVAYQIANSVRLVGGAQNLFDIAYYEHLNRSVRGNMARAIFAPGRNVFLSLSVDLQ